MPVFIQDPAAPVNDSCHWILPPLLPESDSTGMPPVAQKDAGSEEAVPASSAVTILCAAGMASFNALASPAVLVEALKT